MKKSTFLTIFILIFMIIILLCPGVCLKAAENGLLLWFNKILPSMLPFMILINILVPLDGLSKVIGRSDKYTKRLWHLPGYSFFTFITGLIASYPMGAKIVKNLYSSNKLTKEEAELTLCFTNNCGPLFIIGTIGTAMLSHTSIGYYLLLIHILSALIMSLLITRGFDSKPFCLINNTNEDNKLSFPNLLNNAVMNAMDTITCVGGYIILFSVITSILTETPILPYINPTDSLNPVISAIVAGFLELSNGCARFSAFPLSIYSIAAIGFVTGFGGLCVYFQTSFVLQGSNLSMNRYLKCKLLQGVLSFGLVILFYPLFAALTHTSYISVPTTAILIGSLIIFISVITILNLAHSTNKAKKVDVTV